MSFNVAIDGPAGAGKSTIAKSCGKEEGIYLCGYRSNVPCHGTVHVKRGRGTYGCRRSIADKCKEADITIQYVDGEQVVLLNGENVNAYLRTEEVGNMASTTSAQPAVRTKLVELQQALAA